MGTRSAVACLAIALALSACSEQQEPESVAGPSLGGRPTSPAACDPNALNSLISGYFPGSSSTLIKSYKDAMVATPNTETARNNGFAILDSIGSLSRQTTVDGAAGSLLAQGVIKCMFDATKFDPPFPSSDIYNFAPALNAVEGGGFYTRGANTGGNGPVQAGLTEEDPVNVLSAVNPLSGTWSAALADNAGSEGRVLIYGYPITTDPLEYEWATIPPAATFKPGAIVAICDGTDPDTSMVRESTIGVLAYHAVGGLCTPPISVVIKETGWGPRALAARLARVVVDAVRPTPLQAAARLSGTGGTATTFKSRFTKKGVTTVDLTFTTAPKSVIRLNQPATAEVRATTLIDGDTTGVNGVCVYLIGANNNGVNTALGGSHDDRCKLVGGTVDAYTQTKGSSAGFASFSFSVNKTGGLIITATATDDSGSPIGVVGRNGQTFGADQAKTNVKP